MDDTGARMQNYISPEPIRSMFDSDESHAVAWLQWASGTPGGWQARLADKAATGHAGPDHVTSAWSDAVPAVDRPAPGAELVKYVGAQSACCRATVVVDPLVPEGSRGICSTCGTVLDYVGPWWMPRAPEPGNS